MHGSDTMYKLRIRDNGGGYNIVSQLTRPRDRFAFPNLLLPELKDFSIQFGVDKVAFLHSLALSCFFLQEVHYLKLGKF